VAENPNILLLLKSILVLRDDANKHSRVYSEDVLKLMELMLTVLREEGIIGPEGTT